MFMLSRQVNQIVDVFVIESLAKVRSQKLLTTCEEMKMRENIRLLLLS